MAEEFLYDKDILNSPLWYNTAVQLGVDPALTPDTPDLDGLAEEFLYDKDILNSPLWYNTAVQLGVAPAFTHRINGLIPNF